MSSTLYYSNPKIFIGRADQRGMRRAEYQKMAPSKFKYTVTAPTVHLIRNAAKSNLHCISAIMYNRIAKTTSVAVSTEMDRFVPSYSFSQLLPFPLPAVMVAFKDTPTATMRNQVEQLGGTVIGMGNASDKKYLVERGSAGVIQAALSMDNLNDRETAPKNYINAANADLYLTLVTRITNIGFTLDAFSLIGSRHLGVTIPTDETNHVVSTGDIAIIRTPEYTATGSSTQIDESLSTSSLAPQTSMVFRVSNAASTNPTGMRFWTTSLSALPRGYTHGNFARFEKDYASYDHQILYTFINTFGHFFLEAEKRALLKFWDDELCETDTGLAISHYLMTCIIAYQADRGVSPLFSANRRVYHGAVLTGRLTIETPSGPMVAQPIAVVNADIGAVKTHDTVLADVVRLLGITVPVSELTSLRAVRSAAGITYDNFPATVIQNQVKALLPYLDFGVYTSINARTITNAMKLLADPTLPIPADLPLHPGYFFTANRFEDVLASFGSEAPDFWTGPAVGNEYRMTNTPSRAGEIKAPEPYSATAPITLQSLRTDVTAAAGHWRHIMTYGTCHMITRGSAGQGSRSYTGLEKADLWRAFNEWVGVSVARGRDVPTSIPAEVGATDPGLRRRRDDDDDEEELARERRRVRTTFDFN